MQRLLINALPVARILLGVLAGYFCLEVDTYAMDAVVAAAAVPVFFGLFTEELEAR